MTGYIQKKINNSHIVWFEYSNRWIQFAEPAWYVNKLKKKGLDRITISHKFAKKYSHSKNESLHYVDQIYNGVDALSVCEFPVNDRKLPYLPSNYAFIPYSIRYYLIRNKSFAIVFGSRLAEYYVHPPLAHLEIEHTGAADMQYDVFSYENIPFLREPGNPQIANAFEDFNQLKRRLFINMANIIHHKTNNDWMSFVHASAITDGKETILFSSASGSGKSSMAALLQHRGLQLVADDFVPIDAKTKRAFPFPAAISVKEGAFGLLSPYYGNLGDRSFNAYEYSHHAVRFLKPILTGLSGYKAKPVNKIVFIRYNPDFSCNFKPLPTVDALKLFHEEAWVSNNPRHARSFINWFVKLQCFQLEYGNTEMGVKKVLSLFKSAQ